MSDGSAPLAGYAQERARLIEQATPGLAAAEDLAQVTDEAVAGLTATASQRLRRPVAVLALGGYGARRLLPASDIDLLVVFDGPASEIEPFTREVFYPFWDLGLQVGHQVRSQREHSRAVREDLTILTATLTARLVAGDESLGRRVIDETVAWGHRKRVRIMDEMSKRDRPGSPYLLEPDLKEGAGGQRDIDELVWLAALLSGRTGSTPGPLTELDLLHEPEVARITSAQDELATARWIIGASGASDPNLMTLDTTTLHGLRTDAVQRALADVHHTLLDVRTRLDSRTAPDTEPWTPEGLIAMVSQGTSALQSLERAAWSGALDSLLPDFSSLLVLRRPGLSHRLTVGAHSIRAAVSLAEDTAGDDFTTGVLQTLPDLSPLAVATLAHDVGKRDDGQNHGAHGAQYAEETARRFGLSRPLAWAVSTLVREHLLLSDTVNTQDLTDEDVILRTASRLGDRSLVGPLYLLTRADMMATGPGAWTPWRAALIRQLTTRLDAALSDDVDGVGIIAEAARVRDAALRGARSAGMERTVLQFVEEVPLRYLADRAPDEVLRHARLVHELRGPLGHGGVVLDVTVGAAPETWRITIVTRDREGLFGLIGGVISLVDLDILSAEAFTETSGVVLDVFTVTGATLAPVEHDRWARLERLLRAAIAGRLDVEARLLERQKHYPTLIDGPGKVTIDTSGPLATIVRVQAPDRIGLLHDLAAAMHDAGLDIRLAVAHTRDGVASDVFHVIDAQGAPPKGDTELHDLRTRLERIIAQTTRS